MIGIAIPMIMITNYDHDYDHDDFQAIILSGACGSGKTYASMVLLRQVIFLIFKIFIIIMFEQLFDIAKVGLETDSDENDDDDYI